MKTLKALAAVVLIGISGVASAQGYYHGYYNRPPPNVYNYYNVHPHTYHNHRSFRYEHLYGAAIVGAITGVIIDNAMRPQPPVIVTVPAQEPVIVTREEWVYDSTCDCKRRQVYRTVQ